MYFCLEVPKVMGVLSASRVGLLGGSFLPLTKVPWVCKERGNVIMALGRVSLELLQHGLLSAWLSSPTEDLSSMTSRLRDGRARRAFQKRQRTLERRQQQSTLYQTRNMLCRQLARPLACHLLRYIPAYDQDCTLAHRNRDALSVEIKTHDLSDHA